MNNPSRIKTIALVVDKINQQKASEKPGPTKRRVSALFKMDDQRFIDSMTKEIWEK